MYQYVEKKLLKESHSFSASLVNQLVQELKKYDIEAKMQLVGSGGRGLITRNGKGPIDFDYNLWILSKEYYNQGRELKEAIMKAFDYVLYKNHLHGCYCKDSTSVISTGRLLLNGKSKISFSIDICIVREDSFGNWHRLIHDKNGSVQKDRWFWNQGPNGKDIRKKEEALKPEYWLEVRETYLKKKNHYLVQQDYNHPSFKCYIEAVNEVHNKYFMRNKVTELGFYTFNNQGGYVNGRNF